MQIEWAETALTDMGSLAEFRLRVGDYRVRFHQDGDTMRILRVRHRKDAYR
jgi:mRNA-degrading endonuclease RelE of RelBE toxin-antitoxin system